MSRNACRSPDTRTDRSSDRHCDTLRYPELLPGTGGKAVIHNDPSIDPSKAWPWEAVRWLVQAIDTEEVVLLGNPGPEIDPALDMRGRTTLAQAAGIIREARCYVGIDSGLMWIAGSLQVPTVGLYGTSYIPAYRAIQPQNPRAIYLQAEGTLDGILREEVLAAVRRILFGGDARGK